ncbi:VanZ family protein [Paenibacillus bovis]|nr:VanZ family protein [Paenibacillus bovis]
MRSSMPSYRSRSLPVVRLTIWIVLTLLWMGLIFNVSNQPYQQQDIKPLLSDWIAEPSLAAFTPSIEFTYGGYTVSGQHPYDFWEFFIRKAGHVSEFALLTFLLIRVFSLLTDARYAPLLWAGLVAYAYAMTDEWHQTWIAGRTGHFSDTLIDAIGIVLMVVIYMLIRRRRSRKTGLHFG